MYFNRHHGRNKTGHDVSKLASILVGCYPVRKSCNLTSGRPMAFRAVLFLHQDLFGKKSGDGSSDRAPGHASGFRDVSCPEVYRRLKAEPGQ